VRHINNGACSHDVTRNPCSADLVWQQRQAVQFFGSFVQMGASVGLLVATGVVALVKQFTTPE